MTLRRPAFEMSVSVFLRQKRRQIVAENRIEADEVSGYCVTCGYSHRPEDRRRFVRRMLPCTFEEIRVRWSCFYEDGAQAPKTGAKRLQRDLEALGAVFHGHGIYRGMWVLPEASSRASMMAGCP